ncbi:MAG TPA: DUF2267 domain-containing protein [Candidatus Saccharimonadales bacterium]|nr:DUF2267 domain-containing protein [Candidatus Saccharimonadales bacterium]
MGYRELIKKVQHYSGFTDSESQDALDCMVETLASHLDDGERKDFASQLPQELKDRAMMVTPAAHAERHRMLEQFMDYQNVDESRAKRQMLSAWHALKDAISVGEINHIRSQLPNKIVAFLH